MNTNLQIGNVANVVDVGMHSLLVDMSSLLAPFLFFNLNQPAVPFLCRLLGALFSIRVCSESLFSVVSLPQMLFTCLLSLAANMGRKVTIIGSGNWGATIAKIVGFNAMRYPEMDNTVIIFSFFF